MRGKYTVKIGNNRLRYEFTIKRNITIIKGNSATGKTTLVEMINDYYENGVVSGVDLECDVPCRTLSGRDWKTILPTIDSSIVFIDEDNDFLNTIEFAESIKNTANYYVIVTREGLPYLPYSVDEIYGIRESGKYAGLKQVYNEFYKIYYPETVNDLAVPDKVIVEDSNSGFDFFSLLLNKANSEVLSSGGKSNIFSMLLGCDSVNKFLVIADGAAFGCEIDRIIKQIRYSDNIYLYLPESFEWLILKSGLIDGKRVQEIISAPENHVNSEEYFSWEQFFTALLTRETVGTYLQYSKKKINPTYLHKNSIDRILMAMGRIGEVLRNSEIKPSI